MMLIQLVFSLITALVTGGKLSKHWDSIWRVWEQKEWKPIIVDEDCVSPTPPGLGKWDHTKKCKISLKSCHGRYVCAEGNGTINANRQHCRFVMVYYIDRVNRNGVKFRGRHDQSDMV